MKWQLGKKFLLLSALSLLSLAAALPQDMESSQREYEAVDLTELLGSNQTWSSFDLTMSSSSKQTNELKLEIPSLSNMPIVWPEALQTLEQSLTASKLASMSTSELLSLLDSQLETYGNTIDSQLQLVEKSSKLSVKESEQLKTNVERLKKEKAEAEKIVEHLKAALASNKEDQSLVNSLLGEYLEQIDKIEKDLADTKKYVAFLELQEVRLKRNGYVVPICLATTAGGAILFGYGLATDNRATTIAGLVVMATPTIVWLGGHFAFKWW